jgi:2-hydroxy-3-keto-5-methylthiopentenyl-1-phosphate phosphatase
MPRRSRAPSPPGSEIHSPDATRERQSFSRATVGRRRAASRIARFEFALQLMVEVISPTLPLRVFLDFDGTLVMPNVAILIVQEFAPDGRKLAREVDLALHAQEITLREAWEREARALSYDRIPEMIEFVRKNAPLRPGATELLELLHRHHVVTTVLSGGLDFLIRPVLEREGLDLPVLSETAVLGPSGGLTVEYPFSHPTCRLCGICKALVVDDPTFRSRTVFIGDGSTDRYGAEVADLVFARHRLLDFCRSNEIACYPFEDFGPVVEKFKSWLEQGEALPPPRARGKATSPCPISRALAGGVV